MERAPVIQASHLEMLCEQNSISSSEYDRIQSFLGRVPTPTELGVFGAMWSEHCSYRSSKKFLKKLPVEGKQVVVGPGENAGVVSIDDQFGIAFKMESHNHPSFMVPYHGAATGVGGILRDVFCMGARPIAILNNLRFGEQNLQKTPWYESEVVKGIGDYGNCVGIPTVSGDVHHHPSYNKNILVNAMAVGLIDKSKIFKGVASKPGQLIVYCGGETGRDGVRGASMASQEFSEDKDHDKTTIQIGDPFYEKILMEVTLELIENELVEGLQDMGAAGLTSSLVEMAHRGKRGIRLDLDKIPKRASELTSYELLLSESQERMALCVQESKLPEIEKILDRWQLPFAVVGHVIEEPRFICSQNDQIQVDVPIEALVEGAPSEPVKASEGSFEVLKKRISVNALLSQHSLLELCKKIMLAKPIQSKIYQQYDQHVGTRTILGPEHGGAAVLWIKESQKHPHLGLALASGCEEAYCAQDPYLGGSHSVLKPLRMLAASGAVPLGITDCLNFGSPRKTEIVEQFSEAIEGIRRACFELDTPVVSGNVSFYNETDGKSIDPTPMIGAVGRLENCLNGVPATIKDPGQLYLVHPKEPEWHADNLSLMNLMNPDFGGFVPKINWIYEKQVMQCLAQFAQNKSFSSVRDIGSSGLLMTLHKMLLRDLGADLNIPFFKKIEDYLADHRGWYFAHSFAASSQLQGTLVDFPEVAFTRVGEITESNKIVLPSYSIERSQL